MIARVNSFGVGACQLTYVVAPPLINTEVILSHFVLDLVREHLVRLRGAAHSLEDLMGAQ